MTFTRPWAVKQELTRQNEQANRIYYEPRCHEGNHGLAGCSRAGGRRRHRSVRLSAGPEPFTPHSVVRLKPDATDLCKACCRPSRSALGRREE
jgi:hypothetical protein